MSTTKNKLRKTLQEVYQIRKVRAHLEDLDKRLNEAYKGMKKLNKMLDEEYKDLEKLDKLSLKSVFYKVLGSKEEQKEKERQEYLQAVLKYEEYSKSVDLLEYEKNVLEEKLAKKQGMEALLERLLKQREKEVIRESGKAARDLLHNQKQVEQEQMMIWEIREAMKVGVEAGKVLEKMVHFLSTARNWGQWDMASRGRQSSYFKHSNIDRARERAYLAQRLLQRFEDELRDVYSNVESLRLNLDLGSFSRFVDVFFDNLISDWIIQQKIQNALTTVKGVRDRLARLMGNLEMEEKQSNSKIKALQKSKREILKNS